MLYVVHLKTESEKKDGQRCHLRGPTIEWHQWRLYWHQINVWAYILKAKDLVWGWLVVTGRQRCHPWGPTIEWHTRVMMDSCSGTNSIYKHIVEAHVCVWSDQHASFSPDCKSVISEGVCQSQSDTDEDRIDIKSMCGARYIEVSDQATEWLCQSQCSYKGDEGSWSGQFLWKSILSCEAIVTLVSLARGTIWPDSL